MKIVLYSKPDCTICSRAKEKLELMKLPYETKDLKECIEHHEGWQKDNTHKLLAFFTQNNQRAPVIEIDGEYYDYPGAMQKLKCETDN